MKNKIRFFGYGSFCNKEHMKKYLGINYNLVPTRIKRYKRVFARIMSEEDKKTRGIKEDNELSSMLTLVINPKSTINGVLFEVDKKQLEFIKGRDLFYDLHEVDVYDSDNKFLGRALTFISKNYDNKGRKIVVDTFVLPNEGYLAISRKGAYSFGGSFGKEWDMTTYLTDNNTIEQYLKNKNFRKNGN